MTYGITCLNTSGELTLSSEAITLGYLGKATLVAVSHYSGDAVSASAGYATWQFSSPGPIVAALGLKATGQSGAVIQRIYRHDSSTWYIKVYDMLNSTEGPSSDFQFYEPSSLSDIYVFGLPPSLPPYGVAMYDASGNLSADLSRVPFSPKVRVSMATNVMNQSIPAMTKPAIVGYPNTSHNLSSSGHGGLTPWLNTYYEGAWEWLQSTSVLNRGDYLTGGDRDDGGVPVNTFHGPCTGILIEANGLT